MEAAPGVTDSGVCAGVVNNQRSAISVTESTCYKDSVNNNKETIPEEDFIVYHNDCDLDSESEWTRELEDVVSSRQDKAHCQCQEQVKETLHIKNGSDKTWRSYNPFNLWRDKSYNATAKTENAVDVINCKCSSVEHVLDVVCADNTNIESAFSKCRVSRTNNASNLSKQNIYPSECNIDVSDGKTNTDVSTFEGANKHEEELKSSTNSIRSLVFGPITNLLQFPFRRIYPCASPVASSNWNCEEMGNLQGSEGKSKGGGTGKSPAKGKKDKSGKKSPAKELLKHKPPAPPPPSKSTSGTSGAQQKVVPPQGNVPTAGSHAVHNGTAAPQQSAVPSAQTTTYVVTDSWRHVKKLAIKTPAPNNTTLITPPSRDSSSESVFTDPLTPQGFADAHNNSSYYSDTCSTEQANENAAISAYFQTLSVDDSVFTSLKSDVGMVGSDGGSDKDRIGGSTPLSTTDLDDVTLTVADDSSEHLTDVDDIGGSAFMTSVQKPQSHSLDALDEEDNAEDSNKKTKSLDSLEITAGVGAATPHTRTTQPPSSFTLVKHRKVELNPARVSEHCLLPTGKHSQNFHRNT